MVDKPSAVISDRPAAVGEPEAPPPILAAAKRLREAKLAKQRAEVALAKAKQEVAKAEEEAREALKQAGLTKATVQLSDTEKATVYLLEKRYAGLEKPAEATDEEKAAVLATAVKALKGLGLDEYVRTAIEFQGLAALIRAVEDANTAKLQEFGDLPPALLQHVGEPAEDWLPKLMPGIKLTRIPGVGLRVTEEK